MRIERGLSKNTIDNYTFDIERLIAYLEEHQMEISPIKISEEQVQQFIYAISTEANLSPYLAWKPPAEKSTFCTKSVLVKLNPSCCPERIRNGR